MVEAAEMRGVGRREGFGQPLSKLICFFAAAADGDAIFVMALT